MGLKQRILGGVAYFLIERPAKNNSFNDLAEALEKGRQTIQQRLASATDKESNRDTLSHIIGIERWGQRRLQVALGQPMATDEYDGYRPDAGTSFEELGTIFEQTRQVTMQLAKELGQKNLNRDFKILHNDFGPLTPRGWLRYLTFHANREANSIKK